MGSKRQVAAPFLTLQVLIYSSTDPSQEQRFHERRHVPLRNRILFQRIRRRPQRGSSTLRRFLSLPNILVIRRDA